MIFGIFNFSQDEVHLLKVVAALKIFPSSELIGKKCLFSEKLLVLSK